MCSFNIESIGKYVPPQAVSSNELLNTATSILSDVVIERLSALGVKNRYSIIEDYPNYLIGKQERKYLCDVNDLAVNSIKQCIGNYSDNFDIGLFICITNTAKRHLPCTAYDVVGLIEEDILPNNVNIINMQNQGCSVLAKALDFSQAYLYANPNKNVLITFAEAHTALFPPSFKGKVYDFNYIKTLKDQESKNEHLKKLHNCINNYLFGDAAVSLLLSHEKEGLFHAEHLTNQRSEDADVLSINQGGTGQPGYKGFPYYYLGKNVPKTGLRYSRSLLDTMCTQYPNEMNSVNYFLIHTGSKKIINHISKLISADVNKFDVSYKILEDFGNLSSCSIGFMLQEILSKCPVGEKVNFFLFSFGVGFSGSVALYQTKVNRKM